MTQMPRYVNSSVDVSVGSDAFIFWVKMGGVHEDVAGATAMVDIEHSKR
jgi:hypothetical protein